MLMLISTIYRYIQLGVHIKAYYSQKYGKFHREIDEIVEFYVDDENKPMSRTIYKKDFEGNSVIEEPSAHLLDYLSRQGITISSLKEAHPNVKVDNPFEQKQPNVANQTTPIANQTTGAPNVNMAQPMNPTPSQAMAQGQAVTPQDVIEEI